MSTKLDRIRREETKRQASQWADQYSLPNNVDRYIYQLKKLMEEEPVSRIDIYGRVSLEYKWRSKLQHQIDGVRKAAKELGIEVVATFGEWGPGWHIEQEQRPALYDALWHSGMENVHLVTATASRFVRGTNIHAIYNTDAIPTENHLKDLIEVANLYGQRRLACLLEPDAPFHEDKQFLSDLSVSITGKVGGRPKRVYHRGDFTRREWNTLRTEALELVGQGHSLGGVAKTLQVARGTVQSWKNQLYEN